LPVGFVDSGQSSARVHRPQSLGTRLLTWIDADDSRPPSWTAAAPYVDMAIVGQAGKDIALAQTLRSAGIGVVEYSNPNRQAQAGIPHFPHNLPGDFARDCTGLRIYKLGIGVPTPPPPEPTPTPQDLSIYQMDPNSSNLAQSWAGEVTAFSGEVGAMPAYVFEDDADSLAGMSHNAPCDYQQPAWTAAANMLDTEMAAQAAVQGVQPAIVYNGLDTGPYPSSPTYTPSALDLNASAAGGMAENCYSKVPGWTRARPDPTPYPAHDMQWLSTENVEIAMTAAQRSFVCNANSDNDVDAAARTELRKYVIASILLTYDPQTTILDEQFKAKSGLSVFPESEFVVTDPIDPTPAQITDLEIGNVYARRYGACSVDGVSVGGCAIVVNPSSMRAYPFPYPGQYMQTLHLIGGGVLDPGSMVEVSNAGPPSVQAESAVIAVEGPQPSPSPSP
jgi:hypothetical protein